MKRPENSRRVVSVSCRPMSKGLSRWNRLHEFRRSSFQHRLHTRKVPYGTRVRTGKVRSDGD
ncbi:unnamed protein product [Nippostrongylus brasiliensis]|uniref:Ribosomal protein L34 n=1 Tax=Nippostrongylus brasiliensis TaxID=27835 RepID=A0A0N4XL39_NIPBR|nr:unnamed protein product [Nippostrongylus brasiliensis]